jgi:hypothetical protein
MRSRPSTMVSTVAEAAPHYTIWSEEMRYLVAWLLGVPISVLVLWYVINHAL